MAYIKGVIPKDKVKDFVHHLADVGYSFRHSNPEWELYQVLIDNRWRAITVDGKSVVGLPEELVQLARDFLQSAFAAEITDTERLDFLLPGHRKVVVESVGYNGRGDAYYEVYVTENFMEDFQYPAVRVVGTSVSTAITPEVKRQAIDLAINKSKGVKDEQ